MTPLQLFAELHRRGVVLRVSGDKIRFDAPAGALTPELRSELKERKGELLSLMRPADDNQQWSGWVQRPRMYDLPFGGKGSFVERSRQHLLLHGGLPPGAQPMEDSQ